MDEGKKESSLARRLQQECVRQGMEGALASEPRE
jgi:hypothetical protein